MNCPEAITRYMLNVYEAERLCCLPTHLKENPTLFVYAVYL